MTTVEIYKLDKDKEEDVLTDTSVWRYYFKEKDGIYHEFGSKMKKMQQRVDNIMNKFTNDSVVNYSHAKLEREYQVYRDWDKMISEDALKDSHLFGDISKSLTYYREDEKDKLILRNYEQCLKDARKMFETHRAKTELMKEKYHKKSFEMEKAEIKKELSEKEAEIQKFTDRFESLRQKANEYLEKYKEDFSRLKASGKSLREESKKYTTERIKVDTKRADFILDNLRLYAREVIMRPDNAEEVDLKGLNVKDIVKCRVPKETIEIKKIERYKSTKNKEELIQQMKKEIEEERKRKKVEVEEDSDDDGGGVNVTENVPPDPAQPKGVGRRYLVTSTYKKQAANEISLTQGKFVKMIMPANSKGMAFGEKNGRFGRKTKGYFPMNHVTPAESKTNI